eukprot:226179-Prymnesium_polylepis.2
MVVSAPADVQRARVLARPNMQAMPEAAAVAKFEAILAKQMPDEVKRAQPHVAVIDTGASIETTRCIVGAFVTSRRSAGVRPRWLRGTVGALAVGAATLLAVGLTRRLLRSRL